jgi:hypothetical protein
MYNEISHAQLKLLRRYLVMVVAILLAILPVLLIGYVP